MNDSYTKKCSFCSEYVSIFESLTEFGKHYHHNCMVHKLNIELETYKKKYLDGKMSSGDKTIFLDKFKLSRDLMVEKTEFKGWKMVEERKTKKFNKEKVMLVEPVTFLPILDKDGKPQYVEDAYSNEMTVAILRPDVITQKMPQKTKALEAGHVKKTLTIRDVPRLMGEI